MKKAYTYFGGIFRIKINRAIVVGAIASRVGTLAFTAALSLYVLSVTGIPAAIRVYLTDGNYSIFRFSVIESAVLILIGGMLLKVIVHIPFLIDDKSNILIKNKLKEKS